jgi:exodeoxyribonuclease VII large subunit
MHYILSVTEINKYIKEILSRDLILSNLWVRGEISNCKYHYSGHMYFTLKDDKSLLKCVMFKTHASNLKFRAENGMRIIVKGYISVFERDGQYQLYAEEIQPDGIGSLHIAFEQMKRQLQSEGLFDEDKKQKLPMLPSSIGVVTSSTGAVIKDILNVLKRRFPNFNLKLFPVHVQGEQASREIAHAIDKFNELGCVDVIIVARGGGSIEELWAFNEEIVARSIFNSKIPVISAVGHETDYTIADFVADVRAPTPSAAAEIVMPEKAIVKDRINALNSRLVSSLLKNLSLNRMRFDNARGSIAFRQPFNRIYQERMRLDLLNKSLLRGLKEGMTRNSAKLSMLAGKLDVLSPLSIMSRGYSIVTSMEKGGLVKSVRDVGKGEKIQISVSDGRINCTVVNVAEGDNDGQKKKIL